MSRAFTREDDGSAPEALPDLPQSPHPNYVTPAGLADLQARLAEARAALAGLLPRKDEIDARLPLAMEAAASGRTSPHAGRDGLHGSLIDEHQPARRACAADAA